MRIIIKKTESTGNIPCPRTIAYKAIAISDDFEVLSMYGETSNKAYNNLKKELKQIRDEINNILDEDNV